MTQREEKELLNSLRILKKEIRELKEMLEKKNTPAVVESFVNTTKACKILGCSLTKLYQLLDSGELPFATKMGRQWRFPLEGLKNYIGKTY